MRVLSSQPSGRSEHQKQTSLNSQISEIKWISCKELLPGPSFGSAEKCDPESEVVAGKERCSIAFWADPKIHGWISSIVSRAMKRIIKRGTIKSSGHIGQ
jgi:hypothetical protein